jgi:Asp-tRNA(Asn)/Glu-tRNA(Gln) amidotransferase A subunit family amidase
VSAFPGSAAGIAAAVAAGEISAAAVTAAYLEAAVGETTLNAFTLIDAEGATTAAAAVDRRRSAGEEPGLLAGVPAVLKDLIDQAGLPTTCGSGFYREVPGISAAVVRRLEEAGAVVLGRTGLHEFAFGFSSENDWWGPVRNPWDPATSPGGSSGGSAAAVAAGLAPVGIGTDTGGSVRVPAALCGLVGLKPTHGRVPLTGVFPLAASLDTVGPLARTVGDAALAYRVMAGHAPDDPRSADRPVTAPAGPADLSRCRFAVPLPWTAHPLSPEVRDGFRFALEALARQGAAVEQVHVPELAAPGLAEASMYPEVAAVHRGWMQEHPERYGPDVRHRLERALAVGAAEHAAGLAWRGRVRRAFDALLAGFDAVVTPTTAVLRKEIGEEQVATEEGPIPYRQALSAFTALVNHAGHPALALPLAVPPAFPNDPPPSLQAIARRWEEHRLLEIGLALEQAALVAFRPPAGWAAPGDAPVATGAPMGAAPGHN